MWDSDGGSLKQEAGLPRGVLPGALGPEMMSRPPSVLTSDSLPMARSSVSSFLCIWARGNVLKGKSDSSYSLAPNPFVAPHFSLG